MLRFYAPGIVAADLGKGQTRVGSSFMVEDAEHILCIDGRCGTAADRVVKRLDARKKKKILLLSHPHYDHYNGIEKEIEKGDDIYTLICQDPSSFNKKYSDEVKGNVEALERIIKKARDRRIAVVYTQNGSTFKFGDIKFVTYREQPDSARNSETYINQGSLNVWLPEQRILYTGDTGACLAKKYGLNPIIVIGMHHGNWLSKDDAEWLYKHGCLYYLDDDYSTSITDFLSTGRGKAKKAGMTIFSCHGDLNIVAFSNRAIIYKNGKLYRYSGSYSGKASLKAATLTTVFSVFSGKYGNGDARVTKLLDLGYNPGSVQGWVNKFAGVVK